jgi:hypothetical protein
MAQAREKIKVSKEESVMLKWRLLLTTVPVVAAVPALKDVSRGSELSPATGFLATATRQPPAKN